MTVKKLESELEKLREKMILYLNDSIPATIGPLIGIDKHTLYRYRNRRLKPTYEMVIEIAKKLKIK